MRINRVRLLLVGVLALVAGCENALSPQERVVGEYVATTLLADEENATIDLLQRGAEVGITLHADGSTSGRLFVPDGAPDGGDLDVDLSGRWLIVNGARVSFNHPTPTFLRDRLYAIGDDQLLSDDGGLEIVLSKG